MKDRVGTVVGKSEAMIKSGWGEMFGAFGSFISASKNMVRVRVVGHIVSDNVSSGTDPNSQASEPNPAVGATADTIGLYGAVNGSGTLTAVSAAVSIYNDRSPQNVALTGGSILIPLAFPETAVPIGVCSVGYDGSNFVANQIIILVFTPDASQSDTINDGYGHTITAPNAVDWNQAFVVQ